MVTLTFDCLKTTIISIINPIYNAGRFAVVLVTSARLTQRNQLNFTELDSLASSKPQ